MKLWSVQDPQEQLQKKAEKSQRLKKKQPEILEQIRKASADQQAAQAGAEKHEALAQKLFAQHRANAEEIERLNAESNQVLQSGLGQKEADIGEWMAKTLEGKLKIFDDPIFSQDVSVVQKMSEIQATHAAI